MCRLLYILIISFLVSCKREIVSFAPDLIAHAGGNIDGFVYTNSFEALEQSIADGYRFIELDFQFTADSVLVAAHSWSEFNEQSGYSSMGDSAPCHNDFVSRRLHGLYKPLTARMIDSIFVANPNLFLVTDKVSDADVLESYFPRLKDRILVEAFSYDDYVELKQRGFYRVLYSCMAKDMYSSVVKHMLLHSLFPGDKIEWIALHTSAFDNNLFAIIDLLCNYNAAVFTVKDLHDIPQEYRSNVKMIYTDGIKP